MSTCCFTGHRLLSWGEKAMIRAQLDKFLPQLFEMGVDTFVAGGALGFDTLAALAVLKLQQVAPVELHLILPCRDQDAHWSQEDRTLYADILLAADAVTYAAESYQRGCMHRRDRMLVDASSLCLCYLKEETGGTAYTVQYAKKHGLRVFNLAKKS